MTRCVMLKRTCFVLLVTFSFLIQSAVNAGLRPNSNSNTCDSTSASSKAPIETSSDQVNPECRVEPQVDLSRERWAEKWEKMTQEGQKDKGKSYQYFTALL